MIVTMNRIALECLAAAEKIAATILLTCFMMLPAQTRAQDRPTPTPTPPITPTATPSVTATPVKSMSPYGTPNNFAPNPSPTIPVPLGQPSPTPIPDHDQPPSGDARYGTSIEWVVYQPTTAGPDGGMRWPPSFPLHIGGYKQGDFYHNFSTAPQDLRDAGFVVFVATYPLAPPRSITGQYALQQSDPNSGRYPQQTRAIEAVVDAARRDGRCYHGLVGVLGGSAGGSHAIYVALDVTNTGLMWPFWSSQARPTCVVSLSGQYDFSDRDQDVLDDTTFIPNIENYTNSATLSTQWAASPVGLVSTAASFGFIPMYFMRAMADPGSPLSTQDYMWYALSHANPSPPTDYYHMWSVPPEENADPRVFPLA